MEILKDGASAIYGTDAIGGVINFILRKDYQGAEAAASASGTSRGGGSSDRYTATLGFGDVNRSGFNVLALVDYQKDKPLGASQRAFAAAPDVAVAVRTDGLPLHVAARVQEKAAEGMTALRRYVWITRGMHELDLRALLADEGTR